MSSARNTLEFIVNRIAQLSDTCCSDYSSYIITVKSTTSDGFQNRRLCSTTFDSTCSHQLMTSCEKLPETSSSCSTKYSVSGFRFGRFNVFSSCWIFADTLPLARPVTAGTYDTQQRVRTTLEQWVRTRTTLWSSLLHAD